MVSDSRFSGAPHQEHVRFQISNFGFVSQISDFRFQEPGWCFAPRNPFGFRILGSIIFFGATGSAVSDFRFWSGAPSPVVSDFVFSGAPGASPPGLVSFRFSDFGFQIVQSRLGRFLRLKNSDLRRRHISGFQISIFGAVQFRVSDFGFQSSGGAWGGAWNSSCGSGFQVSDFQSRQGASTPGPPRLWISDFGTARTPHHQAGTHGFPMSNFIFSEPGGRPTTGGDPCGF